MNKLLVCILITGLMLFLALSTSCFAGKKEEKPSIIIGNKVVALEIADTEAKRQFGLMKRKYLPENAGMLFIFDRPTKPVFWMKDCYIPLDIIFIRGSKIVNMYTSVPPCKEIPCEKYPSIELVDKVLEVNAGFAKKNNVKINDTVKFKGFRLK